MFSLLPPLVKPNQIAHSVWLPVTQSSYSDFWLMIGETSINKGCFKSESSLLGVGTNFVRVHCLTQKFSPGKPEMLAITNSSHCAAFLLFIISAIKTQNVKRVEKHELTVAFATPLE